MADLPRRRELSFAALSDMIADAEHLRRGGYDRAGNWDLAQVAGHLAAWLSYPMDGFPKPPLPVRVILTAMRKTVGKRMLKTVLEAKSMPAGRPTVPGSVPPAGGDEAAALSKLREAVGRAEAFTGGLKPSPLFGPLTRDAWVRLNLVHAAHHLSFLTPKTS